MKNVLYILPSLEAGGAEKAAILVANDLSREYHCSITFYTMHKGDHFRHLIDPAITVVENETYKSHSRLSRIVSTYFRVPLSLFVHVKEGSYDVVVSGFEIGPELPVMILSIVLSLTGQRRKIRFVSVIQNSLAALRQNNQRNKFVMGLVSFLRPRIFENIIAVSGSIAKELGNGGKHRISIIENPVDRAAVEAQSQKGIPHDLGPFIQKGYFINVARISRQKNQLLLLRAFNSVKHIIPENVLIAGMTTESDYLSELKTYIRHNDLGSRVHYLGVPENHYPLVAGSKAFLFSSLYEGLPLALLEAMVLRKIIVSSKFTGHEDILSRENAILVDGETDFAQAMVEISKNTMRTEHLVEQASRDSARFDMSAVSGKYHAVFNEKLGGPL